jgi:predicted permease
MRSLWRRLRYRNFHQDVEQELDFHRKMAEEELGDAHAARRAMGNETRMREDSRAVWIAPWLESVWQDLRYAFRSLLHSPGFTLSAVGALALAIGVNTSYFTVFNAIAIRPWPVADPANIVTVFSSSVTIKPAGLAVAEYRYLRDRTRTLQGLIAYRATAVRLGFEAAGKASPAQHVSANFFDVLAVGMAAGRSFRADEDDPNAPAAVAVLAFTTWVNHFGSDPAIVGRTVRIDDVPFTVVGVTAEEFTGVTAGQTSLYLPMAAMRLLPRSKTHALAFLTNPGNCCASVAGRLAPGATRSTAKSELDVLTRQFHEGTDGEKRSIQIGGTQFFFMPGAKTEMKVGLGLLYMGVTLLLLLACANVGNLCLARAAARAREFAVRGSLGAGRSRLIRQLLTEGFVVALIAVVPGVALAFWLPSAIIRATTDDLPSIRLTPDMAVLAYAVLLGAFCTVLFALTPALAGTKAGLHEVLKSGGAGSGSRFRLRMVLLGTQTALSVVLLVAAGLMTRGVQRVGTVSVGFDVDHVSALEIDLPADSYTPERVRAIAISLDREMALLPDTALGLNTPLSNVRHHVGLHVPGRTPERQSEAVQLFEASPRYFEVLRIALMEGRTFTTTDVGSKRIVVNQVFARKYWPNESAVGATVYIGDAHEIVGVVADAQTSSLGSVTPAYFRPISGDFLPTVLVRPQAVQQARAAILRIEPRADMRVIPLRTRFDRQMKPIQVGAAIAGALSFFGLLLASMGVFGVCAFLVQQRRREIGVRVALGARPTNVIAFVLGANGQPLVIGLCVGAVLAVGCSKLLESELYGVSPLDTVTYAAVFVVLALAGAIATAVPAWRAVKLDPLAALRCD